MSACPHPAHRALHLAPIPCPQCRGWLERDGTVLSTPAMLERYPWMAANTQIPELLPDYEPTEGGRVLAGVALAGAIARALLAAIFAAAAIGVIVAILLILLHR